MMLIQGYGHHMETWPTRLPSPVRADPEAIGWVWPSRFALVRSMRSCSSSFCSTLAGTSGKLVSDKIMFLQVARRVSHKCARHRNRVWNCEWQAGHVPEPSMNLQMGSLYPCTLRMCCSKPLFVAKQGRCTHCTHDIERIGCLRASWFICLSSIEETKK